jgi:hypothetical protein
VLLTQTCTGCRWGFAAGGDPACPKSAVHNIHQSGVHAVVAVFLKISGKSLFKIIFHKNTFLSYKKSGFTTGFFYFDFIFASLVQREVGLQKANSEGLSTAEEIRKTIPQSAALTAPFTQRSLWWKDFLLSLFSSVQLWFSAFSPSQSLRERWIGVSQAGKGLLFSSNFYS